MKVFLNYITWHLQHILPLLQLKMFLASKSSMVHAIGMGGGQGTAKQAGQANTASCKVKAGRSAAGSCPVWLAELRPIGLRETPASGLVATRMGANEGFIVLPFRTHSWTPAWCSDRCLSQIWPSIAAIVPRLCFESSGARPSASLGSWGTIPRHFAEFT